MGQRQHGKAKLSTQTAPTISRLKFAKTLRQFDISDRDPVGQLKVWLPINNN